MTYSCAAKIHLACALKVAWKKIDKREHTSRIHIHMCHICDSHVTYMDIYMGVTVTYIFTWESHTWKRQHTSCIYIHICDSHVNIHVRDSMYIPTYVTLKGDRQTSAYSVYIYPYMCNSHVNIHVRDSMCATLKIDRWTSAYSMCVSIYATPCMYSCMWLHVCIHICHSMWVSIYTTLRVNEVTYMDTYIYIHRGTLCIYMNDIESFV